MKHTSKRFAFISISKFPSFEPSVIVCKSTSSWLIGSENVIGLLQRIDMDHVKNDLPDLVIVTKFWDSDKQEIWWEISTDIHP